MRHPRLVAPLAVASSRALLLIASLVLAFPVGAQINANVTETGTTTLATSTGGAQRDAQNRDSPSEAGPSRLATMAPTASPGQRPATHLPRPYIASEFERYVQRLARALPGENERRPASDPSSASMAPISAGGAVEATGDIRRVGADLVARAAEESDDGANSSLVPPDYPIQPGDELSITLWGSVDADLRLRVDRSGRISIPRVGTVMVAGVRYADLADVIGQRVGLVFKNFQVSVSLSRLRGIRVFVTGFAARPGMVTVSSLSTLSQAVLQIGGPSPAGSFRRIELRRGNTTVTRFDLYDLLLNGNRASDKLLQADDVIHFGPIGPQVGVIGSVNRPAVFEIEPGETVREVLRMAGGFAPVADSTRLSVERAEERATVRVKQIALPADGEMALSNGDVLRAFNAVNLASPIQRQNKRVRVEGEVNRPGEYLMPPDSTLADALARAGGLSASAYVFGAEFTRESVRATQQENYDRALRDMETTLMRATASSRVGNSDEAANQAARSQATSRLMERLRSIRPTGRVVLQLPPDGGQFPNLTLEDGDRLVVPSKPSAVGVFGSVFNSGNYLFNAGRFIDDYLRLAGGPTRGADRGSTYVVRANGSVVSGQQQGNSWFGGGNGMAAIEALPGDTIFVPEEQDKTTFIQSAKDWTQILYQFGLGIAGIKAAIQ